MTDRREIPAATILEVEHTTTYRYAQPVTFGEHRVMFRPRAAHDIQVLSDSIEVAPESDIHWIFDVLSNSVTVVTPRVAADTLRIECRFAITHNATNHLDLPVEPRAERYPFDYTEEERLDLGALREPHYPDAEGRLYEWTRELFGNDARPRTKDLLVAMANRIKSEFRYQERQAEGVQTPEETLALGSGACRDFTLFMMEAVRRLGLAARFVSGYLYDPKLDSGEEVGIVGAGATHAWLQVFIPGSGWVPFDPTNSIFGGASLIRVAYARDPSQAPPVAGTWFGATGDYLGMSVDVKVRRRSSL